MDEPRPRGRVASCLVRLLLLLLALAAIGGLLYYLVMSGRISRRALMNAVGQGRGEVRVYNLAEDRVDLDIVSEDLDPETGRPEYSEDAGIEPLDIGGIGGLRPGAYTLDLKTGESGPGGRCDLQIASGDVYQLFVVPDGIAIAREGHDAENADELDLATSSLCGNASGSGP